MFAYNPSKADAPLCAYPPTGKGNEPCASFTSNDPRPVQPGPTLCTSVIGIKFKDGVVLAADNLVSYGSLARFYGVQRVFDINNKSLIGVMGDFADFQSLKKSIDQKMIDDFCHDDKIEMRADAMYNWLTRVIYNRRCNMNPLFVELAVAGMDNKDEPFLGSIDIRGRSYKDDLVATGIGKHLALPMMRELLTDKGGELNQTEALDCVKRSMELLYYRDCRAAASYTIAICTKTDGSKILGTYHVNEDWGIEGMATGY